MSDLDITEIRGTRHEVFSPSEQMRAVNGAFLVADLGDKQRYAFEAVVRDPDFATILSLYRQKNGGIIPRTLTYTYDGDGVEYTAYFAARPSLVTRDGSDVVTVLLEEAD